MRATQYFSADYADARRRFREAAALAGLAVREYRNPVAAPGGLTLTTDTVRLGARDAERLLILMSGTHGVEGFCGSGLQVGLLSNGIAGECPKGVALLMIHVINPGGFAHTRRVTEGNVDLNRNFVDHTKPYPANPAYEELREAICPRQWNQRALAAANAILDAYAARHGVMELQTAISSGQFTDPAGLFYGGRAPTWSNLTLRRILAREGSAARHAAFVDLHTGLGPHGVGEIINNHMTGHPGFARAMDWYGPETTSTEYGNSASAPIIGDTTIAFDETLRRADVTGITLEFGTEPVNEIREALRADNWLYVHGKPDSAKGRAIRARLRRAFYPDTDTWRDLVWARTVEVTRTALRALAQS
jgi:Protein of unknown function (DUF2817)